MALFGAGRKRRAEEKRCLIAGALTGIGVLTALLWGLRMMEQEHLRDAQTQGLWAARELALLWEQEKGKDGKDARADSGPVLPGNIGLPDDSIWLLLDSDGNIVCQYQETKTTPPVNTKDVRDMLHGKRTEELAGTKTVYRDPGAGKKAVCFAEAGNGRLSVILIPVGAARQTGKILLWTSFLICAVFLGLICYLFLTYFKKVRRRGKRAEIMAVLGDTYYAVYVINLETGRCAIIKGPSDMAECLKKKGTYQALFECLSGQIYPTEREKFRKLYHLDAIRSLRNKQGDKAESEFRRNFDGAYKWVCAEISFVPAEDKSKSREEAVFALKYIHEEKVRELEQQKLLAESLALAQSKGEAKSDFLARMSHDMRTPMNAIIGLTELARKHPEDTKQVEEYLSKIKISSAQLLDLVNDVLDMSKIEQGKMELHETVFSLEEALAENFSLFAQQAEKEGKTFRTRISIQNKTVETDRLHINQICNNILSNAFKFTASGGRIEASVREFPSAYKGKAVYRFVFRDNGVGMSQEFRQKLFQPFEREYNSMTSQICGTGLGMPIVQSILQLMNGKISVWSEEGKGTEVTITIPMKVCGQTEEKPARLLAQEQDSLSGKRVLLVEDNEINMEIAKELLTMQGLEVECAWNGQEAVTRFENSAPWHYDVVLMDLQMPVMNGYEAAARIRGMERPDTLGIPIIAMTANAFSEDIARSLEAGMDAHVAKPVDFEKLKKVMLEKMHEKRHICK